MHRDDASLLRFVLPEERLVHSNALEFLQRVCQCRTEKQRLPFRWYKTENNFQVLSEVCATLLQQTICLIQDLVRKQIRKHLSSA